MTSTAAGRPRVVADGLAFPEGPVALGDGTVACVEMQGGTVTRVHPDGRCEPLADLGGGPNGAALTADGRLVVANNGGLSVADDGSYWWAPDPFDGCVQVVGVGGSLQLAHAAPLPGEVPHRPNDLCCGPDGALYVTDSGNWEDMGNIRPGAVLRIDPGGEVTVAAEVPAMPNGIAAVPDGSAMLVVQSLTRSVLRLPFEDGRLGAPEVLCRLSAGIPDGIALADDGRLFVCSSLEPAVAVFDAHGGQVGVIETGQGSQPTNCCLAGGELFVTLARLGQLVAFAVDAEPAAAFAADSWRS